VSDNRRGFSVGYMYLNFFEVRNTSGIVGVAWVGFSLENSSQWEHLSVYTLFTY